MAENNLADAEANAKAEADALAKQAKEAEGVERARLLAELGECKAKIAELASWRSEQEEFFRAAEEVLAKEDAAVEAAARAESDALTRAAEAEAARKAKVETDKSKEKASDKGPGAVGLHAARPRSRLRQFVFGRGGRGE